MIDYSRFHPITENTELINNFIDNSINNGELNVVELANGNFVNVYDLKDDFFGLRLITTEKKDILAFYPIFDTGEPHKAIVKGISEKENVFESIYSTKIENAYLNSFGLDHIFNKILTPQILGKKMSVSYGGLIFSQEKQLNPPTIKQANGKLVTTKGSSIFYNTQGRPLYDYIYQFKVIKITSLYWNDLIEIIQIKTNLFKHSSGNIEINLYSTERVLQNNYYPKIGDDIMGIMQLSTKLF